MVLHYQLRPTRRNYHRGKAWTWGGMLMLCTVMDIRTCCRGLAGGSSFVRTQQQRLRYPNERQPVPPSSSSSSSSSQTPQYIVEQAQQNRDQIQGSKSYLRAWRHWVTMAIAAIRDDLSQTLPTPVHVDDLVKLSLDLGIAADKGTMPSFESPGARAGYALDYFCRARRLAEFLVDTEHESLPSFWANVHEDTDDTGESYYPATSNDAIEFFTGKAMRKSLVDRSRKRTISMTSIGGGPGFDFVAVTLMATFASSGDTSKLPSFRATVLDYEEGWEDLVGAMAESTLRVLQPPRDDWTIEWGGKCDITQSLEHPNNAACRDLFDSTNLWTCQYCVAENAQKLRASEYVFFQELWDRMPIGSTMFLTETTPRLWPEFYDIIQERFPYLQVGFPNQRGPQLLIRKRSPAATTHPTLSSRDEELLKDFREIAARHEERRRSGWERQVNKRMKESESIPMGEGESCRDEINQSKSEQH